MKGERGFLGNLNEKTVDRGILDDSPFDAQGGQAGEIIENLEAGLESFRAIAAALQ